MINYMITIARRRTSIELVTYLQWILDHDIKKWIIGAETGTYGLKHWQIRIQTRYNHEQMRMLFSGAHIEECSDTWDYEKKEGNYFAWDDTPEKLQIRFGTMRPHQKAILNHAIKQNDRQITVWYDNTGNIGKTWLAMHLTEIGLAYYVPPILKTAREIIQWVASGYNHEKLLIIDIPRNVKWSDELIIAIETLKDGWSFDPRYNAKCKNIRGTKILILTNTKPKLSKLSNDRWDIIDNNAGLLS